MENVEVVDEAVVVVVAAAAEVDVGVKVGFG